MYRLDGRVAVITGGAAGIGRAIAERLALEGCSLAILDQSAGKLQQTSAELRSTGARVWTGKADVGDFAQVEEAISRVCGEVGEIDILVNNAGILKVSPLAEMSVADWEEMFRVNVHGVFNCSKAVLPAMMARRLGRIINLASWKGKRGTPYTGAYSATKFAVIGYTESLAHEVGRYNITVNAICPGMVEGTDMMNEWQQTAVKLGLPTMGDRLPAVPLGRAARVTDIASMAAFLASDEAAYITGEAYNVTGGMWMN